MKMNKIAASLAFIALSVSSVAQAATYDAGTLTPGFVTTFGFNWTQGAFSDTFYFNLSSASDVKTSLNDFPVSLYSFSIYKDKDLFMSVNGGAPIGDGQSATAYNLAAGDYSAVVTGIASGMNGGIYAVSMSAQPVPVPAAAWLLGSGLIGLVAVGRRKEV